MHKNTHIRVVFTTKQWEMIQMHMSVNWLEKLLSFYMSDNTSNDNCHY